MSKFFMITLVILSCSLFANQEEQSEQIDKCDKVYDDCALVCEKNTTSDNEVCFAKCEMLYDKCQASKESSEENTSK